MNNKKAEIRQNSLGIFQRILLVELVLGSFMFNQSINCFHRLMYAARDLTGTVNCDGLIVSSIISKKVSWELKGYTQEILRIFPYIMEKKLFSPSGLRL
jgi:hypothetical protein